MAVTLNGNGGKFSRWLSNGLIGTVAWVIVLVIYCCFRAFGIEDPLFGQVFLMLTGAWIGNLTIAQNRKTARVEEKTEQTAQRVEATAQRVERLADVAAEHHPESKAKVCDE